MSAPTPNRLFPFAPNWKAGVRESFSFDSWVLRSADRSEQTGCNSGNNPRRALEFDVLLKRDQAQRFESLLSAWQARFFGVPHWVEIAELTSGAAMGAVELFGDFNNLSFSSGGAALLYAGQDNYELVETPNVSLGVISPSLDLGAPLARAWPAGTRVYPVLYGAINASQSPTRPTDQVLRASVRFDFEPSVTPGNTADDGEGATLYLGEELSLHRTNWAAGVATGFESDRVMIDRNVGKFDMHSVSHFTPQRKSHEWHIKNRAQAIAMRAWLGRRQGQAIPCWMPSGFADFTLAAAPVGGATHIDVVSTGYGELLAAHPGRRDIIILLRDGTYVLRRITSASLLTPTVDRINFAGALAGGIALSAVERVSFLNLYRQDDRETTINWMTDRVGVVELDLISTRT